MISKFALFCLSIAAATSPVLAQTVVHYREGQTVNPADVAQILDITAPRVMKTRSLRLLDAPQSTEAPVAGPRALSLPVRFAFGSAEIDPSARAQLDALAAGIKLLPPQQSVVIEGHTDAIGTDAYNLQLSQRRASAVKAYLVSVYGITDTRLKDVGFGKYRTIQGMDPFAPENRRVQFRGE